MTLFIFADEFGTMPVADHDGPFLTVAVAIPSPLPSSEKTDGHPEWVTNRLRAVGAYVHVAYVIPFEGYGSRFRSVVGKKSNLARARRLIDGRNARFLNQNGIRPRNLVWNTCMSQSIGAALVKAALTGPIDQVHVHFDEKTLSIADRALLGAVVGKMLRSLKSTLSRFADRADVRAIVDRLRACPPEPVVTWRDPLQQPEQAFGLKLADLVAYFAGKALEASGERNPVGFLTTRGVEAASTDVTPILLRDVDPAVVERWKRDTGLPEPT